eukprot:SAG31_NODE_2219_length_6158_cov_6.237168_2_plen_315_part_00
MSRRASPREAVQNSSAATKHSQLQRTSEFKCAALPLFEKLRKEREQKACKKPPRAAAKTSVQKLVPSIPWKKKAPWMKPATVASISKHGAKAHKSFVSSIRLTKEIPPAASNRYKLHQQDHCAAAKSCNSAEPSRSDFYAMHRALRLLAEAAAVVDGEDACREAPQLLGQRVDQTDSSSDIDWSSSDSDGSAVETVPKKSGPPQFSVNAQCIGDQKPAILVCQAHRVSETGWTWRQIQGGTHASTQIAQVKRRSMPSAVIARNSPQPAVLPSTTRASESVWKFSQTEVLPSFQRCGPPRISVTVDLTVSDSDSD